MQLRPSRESTQSLGAESREKPMSMANVPSVLRECAPTQEVKRALA